MAVTSVATQELPALHSECSALLAVCDVGHSYGAQQGAGQTTLQTHKQLMEVEGKLRSDDGRNVFH